MLGRDHWWGWGTHRMDMFLNTPCQCAVGTPSQVL